MRKILKIAGVVLFSLLYCFATAMSIRAASLLHKTSPEVSQCATEMVFADASDNLFWPQARTESSVHASGESDSSLNETTPEGFSATLRIVDEACHHEYVQRRLTAINLLINYRKTDQIFPFHYHW